MKLWENILDQSCDLLWVCVRPSRLTNGREKGNFRVEVNHCPEGGGKISRKRPFGLYCRTNRQTINMCTKRLLLLIERVTIRKEFSKSIITKRRKLICQLCFLIIVKQTYVTS